MAETPVVLSTTIGLGSSGSDDPGSASPETLRLIHQDELRLLRSQLTVPVALTVLAGAAWIVAELTGAKPALAFLLGYVTVIGLFRSARAARQWWIARRLDPVATAAEAAGSARSGAVPRGGTSGAVCRPPVVCHRRDRHGSRGNRNTRILRRGLGIARHRGGGTRQSEARDGRMVALAYVHFPSRRRLASLGNLTALVVFGKIVEAYSTRSRLLLAYLTAVVAGGLASWWWTPHMPSIGASGGILGLAGFVYALSLRHPEDVPASYGRAALTTMILTGLVGLVGYRFIDNAAHAGGALAGFLVGWLTVPPELPQAERSATRYDDDRVVSIIGAMAGVVLITAALVAGAKVFAERPRSATSLRAELSRRGDGGVDVVLENLKDVPLEAYTLDVYSSNVLVFQQWRDERGFEDLHPNGDGGPIAPHERRVVPLGDPGRPVARPSIHIVAAVFKDGTFEGSAAEYDIIAKRRSDVAADADYWIATIDEALTKPPDQVAAFVERESASARESIRPFAARPT